VHHAASTLKLPLAVAVLRAVEDGRLDLDTPRAVRARFASLADGRPYEVTRDYDSDDQPWARLGHSVPMWWLVERSLAHSSNLATNLLMDAVGLGAVNAVYDRVGATRSRLRRGIQDTRAGDAGLHNTATAADLTAVVIALLRHRLVSPAGADRLERVLARGRWRAALPAGFPPGTYVAHKPGWIDVCCHDFGVVRPVAETPFVLGVFTTTTLDEQAAHAVVAQAAAVVWEHRLTLAGE